jgi:hypothetical protein
MNGLKGYVPIPMDIVPIRSGPKANQKKILVMKVTTMKSSLSSMVLHDSLSTL